MKLNSLHYDITDEHSAEDMLRYRLLMKKWVTGGLTLGIVLTIFSLSTLMPAIADSTNTLAKPLAISFAVMATLSVMAAFIASVLNIAAERTSVIKSEPYLQDVATVTAYFKTKRLSVGSEERLAARLLTEQFVPHVGFRRNGFLNLKRTRKGIEVVAVKAEKLNKIR